MSLVQTIRGPIDSSELGWTLSHEHLTAGGPGMEKFPWIYVEDDAVAAGVAALRRVKEAGVDGLIDLTAFDLGRQIELFQRIADADTGVHIVCATGTYRWVPMYFSGRTADDLAEHYLREIDDGLHGTSIRPGIIKLAWDMEYRLNEGLPGATVRDGLEKCARGAARAAKAAGIPISCHTRAVDELGTPLLDIFEDEGLDLRAVTIGHSNDTSDMAYLTGIAQRGATIGLDRYFPRAGEAELERRAGIALALAQAGYADRVCLGHDASPYYCMAPHAGVDSSGCWLPVPEHEIPWLRANGATEEQIDGLTRGAVRATFEAAAAMAA